MCTTNKTGADITRHFRADLKFSPFEEQLSDQMGIAAVGLLETGKENQGVLSLEKITIEFKREFSFGDKL